MNEQPFTSTFLKRCFWIVVAFFLLRAISMAIIPLTDPSETRYANICWNMAESGNFVEPMLIHRGEMTTFDGKPPLYFQIGGIFCKIFGKCEFSVRLPALLFGILIILCIWWTMRRLSGKEDAACAALLATTSPVFFAFCGISLTDMSLCFCITGAICAYMLFTSMPCIYADNTTKSQKTEKKLYSVAFFFFLGLGMLAKGPVAIVLTGMPVFLYVLFARKWAELKEHAWGTGIIVALCVAVPWYWIMQSRDPNFLEYFFINENIKRFLFKEYGDKFGSGREFFRGMSFIWFLLINITCIGMLIKPLCFKEMRSKLLHLSDFKAGCDAKVALPFLTVVSITLFWCLTSRVPIYYLLYTAPVMAFLTVVLLKRAQLFEQPKWRTTFHCICIVSGIATIVCVVGYYIVSVNTGRKFPQPAYKLALELQKSDPLCKGKKVYMARHDQYSEEFYLGKDNFQPHPNEDIWHSLKYSADCILLITKTDIESEEKETGLGGYDPAKGEKNAGIFKNFPERKLLGEWKEWRVYAPAMEKDRNWKYFVCPVGQCERCHPQQNNNK